MKPILQKAVQATSILVQGKMQQLLPEDFTDSRLIEAMRYSALSEGKRIRPFLVLTTAEIFGIKPQAALYAAVALEFIHVYSLIHDDLPAMDDDDFRRGKPSCHKKFDEATAILAGDSLLTLAFEILSYPETHLDSTVRCELIQTIAKAAGYKGMAGGQMIDIEKSQQRISKEELAKLHRLKTGELFMASIEAGAILGRATAEERKVLRYYAHDLGLAFQIKDDLLDHYEIKQNKATIKKDNTSIVDVVGPEVAEQQLLLLKDQAINHLSSFGDKASLLIELADFVVARKN